MPLPKLGREGYLYYQSTGTRAAWPLTGTAPNLQEVDRATDVEIGGSKGTADVSNRGSGGFRLNLVTLKEITLTFTLIWYRSDAATAAIHTAFFDDETLALAALDGESDEPGAQGIWADWHITEFNHAQPLEEGMSVSVTAVIAPSAVDPEWITVGS